jgi:hypothetical protein
MKWVAIISSVADPFYSWPIEDGRWREALDANGETRRFPMPKFKPQAFSRKIEDWNCAGKKRKWAPV